MSVKSSKQKEKYFNIKLLKNFIFFFTSYIFIYMRYSLFKLLKLDLFQRMNSIYLLLKSEIKDIFFEY